MKLFPQYVQKSIVSRGIVLRCLVNVTRLDVLGVSDRKDLFHHRQVLSKTNLEGGDQKQIYEELAVCGRKSDDSCRQLRKQ